MSPQALSVRYALYYATIFVAIGAHLPFWPLWLEARRLTAAEIGLLLALGSWVKRLANPALADHSSPTLWGQRTIVLPPAASLPALTPFMPAPGCACLPVLHPTPTTPSPQ